MARGGRTTAPYSASSSKLPKKGKSNSASSSKAGRNPPRPANGGTPGPSKASKPAEIADTYTYVSEAPKRSRTSAHHLSLSKDEAGPSTRRRRNDEDEDEDAAMEERIRQVAMRIAGDELLDLDESEESDVDSDAAWESDGSDEERWGDVFRDLDKGKGKKGKSKAQEVVKKPAKPLTVNLDESEDEDAPKASIKKSKKAAAAESETEEEEEDEELEDDSEGDDDEDLDDEELEDDEEDEFAGIAKGTDEDDDEDDDEDEDEETDLKSFKPSKFAPASSPAASVSGDDDEEDEEDDDDEGSGDDEHISDPELPSDLSDEDEDDADLDDLDAFVDNLNAADADVSDEEEAEQAEGKKRKVLPVVSGPAVGEVGLQSNGKLDITSLLSSHPSLAGAKALLPSRSAPSTDASTSILKSGTLTAPLPTVVQDRLDREAAYEKTKEEGQKWSGVMRRVREAEHLSFPLQAGEARGGVKSGGEMVSAFKPSNAMESAVQALLDKANLNTEQGLTAAEDAQLQGQDLSVEEIAAKRAELRYQRELMFRAEKRAKRVAKIKSKTFRKLARKRAEKEGGAGGLSVEDLEKLDPEAAEAEREKLERQRAKERATLRHGARTKFGAEAMKGDFGNDDRRRAREEMLNTRERLSRKIAGRASDEEFDSADDSDADSEGDDNDDEAIKGRAFDQIAALDQTHKADAEAKGQKKGLMNMAFMQRAQERGMKAVREEEDALRRDIEMFGEEGEGESSEEEGGAEVMRLGEGRMVFSGPAGALPSTSSTPAPPPNAEPSNTVHSRRPLLSQTHTSSANSDAEDETPSNPWLTATSSTAGPSRKRNAAGVGSASAADKATAALKKQKGRQGRLELEVEDGRVDIDLGMGSAPAPTPASVSAPVAGPTKASTSASLKNSQTGQQAAASSSERQSAAARATATGQTDMESEDEDAAQQSLLPTDASNAKTNSNTNSNGKRQQADFTSQRDLVAEAFAGDDVVSDFQRDKKRQMEADAPTVQDTSLPGWGSWSGKGLKKRKPNPKFLVKTAGVEAAQRKDFGRDNVIISEKTEKRAKQFLAKDLPYPYTSVAQYEASFNTPVGAEWNSRKVHQRETMPRVIKKPGAIIEPVRRLF